MTISQIVNLINNMGLRYAGFRLIYSIKRKTGIFRFNYPKNPPSKVFISLNQWQNQFKFWGIKQDDKLIIAPQKIPDFNSYEEGYIPFFSASKKLLGKDYDWLTNPDTDYKYSTKIPWWEINDFSNEAGDIKYVWEKSRFAFLYDIIRHDKHTGEDHSKWVLNEILSWIKGNPLNYGPNYKCSQEISLRILNWTYALNFYSRSKSLTEEVFTAIMKSIYWQVKHIYSNINFSRIAVRNNHAITETLTLYFVGLYYPFFPEAHIWKKNGKKWFEEEIGYQIFEDGTFLQYSMNYHRIVIQLLTWAIKSSDYLGESFENVVYERAYKSLIFLYSCQDSVTGWLPNYGHNDGALFFKFSSSDFRDYRPQLNSLHYLLTGHPLYEKGDWMEDALWFKAAQIKTYSFRVLERTDGWKTFESGGYYILQEKENLTFIRCGNHTNRPAQSDNLHIDIWYNGKNILYDGGSYKYNTNPEELIYFMGNQSHNTVMLDGHNQMLKGPRFIWYNWSQATNAQVTENEDEYVFEGEIKAFTHLDESIRHRRIIRKKKDKPEWTITDLIKNKPEKLNLHQYWHIDGVQLAAIDKLAHPLSPFHENGWKSDYYGIKQPVDQYIFITESEEITTTLSIK